MKAEGDVQKNEKQREAQRVNRARTQLATHLGTYDEKLGHLGPGIDALHHRLDLRTDGGFTLRRVGRKADDHVTRGSEVLHPGLMEARRAELRTQVVHVGRLGKSNL